MKLFLACLALSLACLDPHRLLVAGPSALVNPGFEDTRTDWPWGFGSQVPGWYDYGPNSGGESFWNVNFANLGGWAEAFIVDSARSDWGGPPPCQSPEGRYSIGFLSLYPTGALLSDPQWGWSSLVGNRTGDGLFLGRAGIAQSIGIPADLTELTCFYVDLSYPGYDDGSLVLKFNQQVLGYTLEPAVGPNGPTTLLRADLTPVAGQYGELRIGIEGRGFFVVDSIVVVPEASTVAGALLLGIAAAGILMRGHRLANRTPRPALARDDSSRPARATLSP